MLLPIPGFREDEDDDRTSGKADTALDDAVGDGASSPMLENGGIAGTASAFSFKLAGGGRTEDGVSVLPLFSFATVDVDAAEFISALIGIGISASMSRPRMSTTTTNLTPVLVS